jgi:hypothetical protein
MNIDSTMGRIHVCFLYCLLVTIRGLVGSFSLLPRLRSDYLQDADYRALGTVSDFFSGATWVEATMGTAAALPAP